jgi:hypothetical protein
MTTTQQDILGWIARAPKGSTHMLVVCDTFSWDDYPVFVKEHEEVHTVAKDHNGPNMTKLMEVYNLNKDIASQLAETRSFNY